MALSRQQDYWIHPNALSITLNYFGDPQLIQTSMLAGAVILAYEKNVITYDAAHNFREWQLQAYPTQLTDTCKYYVHAELSRTGHTAMVIYSPTKRDLEGRTFVDGAWDATTSDTSWFIYLGEISASVDANGATVERVWTDGLHTGTLATDQHRMEEAQGEWTQMFQLNSATGLIDFLKTVSSAIFNKLTIAKEFIFGGKTLTTVAGATDTQDQSKVNDATLPTTGYTKKYVGDEIAALDDHFLIKDDADTEQSVAGPVTFEQDVTVQGDHAVGGNQTIGGTQEVKGVQTLYQGFKTPNFNDAAGQITGAQLTASGILTVSGLKAMSFEVFELIYNVIRARGGKEVISNAATIESCQYKLTDGTLITPDEFYAQGSSYTLESIESMYLTIKKDEQNKGAIPFRNGDILYGYVNSIGTSGQYAVGGECIMYIIQSDDTIGVDGSMTIEAKLFEVNTTIQPSEEGYYDYVSSNMAPTDGMAVAQRGNTRGMEGRTTSFFFDSETSNIIILQNVTTPRLSTGNYGVINGLLPSDLYDKVHNKYSFLSKYDPAVYARYGIFENVLQFDHQGNIIRRENNRGAWSAAIAGSSNLNERYKSEELTYDVVTYDGQLWKCVKSNVTTAPDQGEGWLLLVAKGDDGTSIKVNGTVGSVDELPKGDEVKDGDGYIVGLDLYIWSEESGEWINAGQFKGENGKTQYLHIAYANKDAQGKIIDFSATDPTGREYIGTCSDFNVDDPAITEDYDPYTWKYNKGDKGDSVTGSTIQYAINQSMTDKPNENEFSDKYPTTINEGDVLWTRTRVNFDNATIKTEWAYSASRQAANGKGINSITTQYSITTDSTQPDVTEESLWHDTIEEAGELVPNSYLWTATITDFEDTSKQDEWSVTVQRISANGTSVTAGKPEYQVHSDGVNPPTGKWSESVPSVGEGQYLWTRIPFIEESTTTYAYSVSKSGQSVTIDEIKYAKSTSAEQPDDKDFSYDTPPSVGEGEYLWTRTTFGGASNKVIYTYAYQGMDNSAVEFSLQPNVTTIYIHDEDSLSTESINLTVRKTTSKGVDIIDNNNDLLADGFKLQYTYDGILDDRKDIILNPETILLEDGSEMLLEDDSAAELEFTVEDILNVKNYIEFYLVKTDTNEIWATCTVAVVHDGESLTSLIVTPKTIFVNVVAGGNKIIDPTKEHTIVFQIKKGDKPQLLSNYTIKVSAGGLVLANIKDEDSYTKSFVISCKNGSSIPPTHTITATKGSLTLTEEVTIHPVQQGLVGSSGKLYYSMGYWDETTAADKHYKNDDKRICYIYHVDSFYERTDNDLKTYTDKDGNTRYYTPDVEVGQFGENGGWAVMPKYSAIIADFIMAKFARFGSPNGGVFYSNLLFSAIGLNKEGNQVPYDMYSDDMFVGDDENGHRLSGTITPNLFLDFLTGFAKFNRINEPFIHANRDVDLNIFQLTTSDSSGRYYTRGLNVSVPYSSNNGAIFMPYGGDIISPTGNALYDLEWDTDGTSSTVIVQSSNEYIAKRFINNSVVEWATIAQYVTVLFSDGRYMDYRSYRSKVNSNNDEYVEFNPQEEGMELDGSGAIQHGSHFIVGGVPTQVLFLLPGDIVKMKSCVGAFGETDWYIENSDGFGIINAKIWISPSKALSTDGGEVEVRDTISLGGRMSPILNGDSGEPIFGSKSVMDLYNESDYKELIEMTVDVELKKISWN